MILRGGETSQNHYFKIIIPPHCGQPSPTRLVKYVQIGVTESSTNFASPQKFVCRHIVVCPEAVCTTPAKIWKNCVNVK